MMPLSHYRDPKIARHAALSHMNDYDSENQSWDHYLLIGTGITALSI